MGNYYSYKRISTDSEKQNFNRHLRNKGLVEYKSGVDSWRDISLIDWKGINPFTSK